MNIPLHISVYVIFMYERFLLFSSVRWCSLSDFNGATNANDCCLAGWLLARNLRNCKLRPDNIAAGDCIASNIDIQRFCVRPSLGTTPPPNKISQKTLQMCLLGRKK